MTTGAKLYYLAATLALTAAAITVFDDGFTDDEYVYVGFLVLMVLLLYWQGSKQKPTRID